MRQQFGVARVELEQLVDVLQVALGGAQLRVHLFERTLQLCGIAADLDRDALNPLVCHYLTTLSKRAFVFIRQKRIIEVVVSALDQYVDHFAGFQKIQVGQLKPDLNCSQYKDRDVQLPLGAASSFFSVECCLFCLA